MGTNYFLQTIYSILQVLQQFSRLEQLYNMKVHYSEFKSVFISKSLVISYLKDHRNRCEMRPICVMIAK
jgi:hypothetical protein